MLRPKACSVLDNLVENHPPIACGYQHVHPVANQAQPHQRYEPWPEGLLRETVQDSSEPACLVRPGLDACKDDKRADKTERDASRRVAHASCHTHELT